MTTYAFKNKGIEYCYSADTLRQNALAECNRAMRNADAVKFGTVWYSECLEELRAIAIRYGHTLWSVAGSAAVLSSMMPWERNIPALILLLDAWASGKRGSELPAVSRNFECVRKFERMMLDQTFDNAFRSIVAIKKTVSGQSFKTRNFFLNLIGASHNVTVDVWMWRILSDDWTTQYRPDGRLYIECANIIRELAAMHNVQPMQMQAIMWMARVNKPAEMRAA